MKSFHLRKLITKDVLHTGFTNVLRLFSAPLLIILISHFLTKEMQGYWYSFISLSALSVFADLGFTSIVMQFAAHEYAFINFDKYMRFQGNQIYINRISSLFKFVLKFSIKAVIITYPIIFLIGYVIMNKEQTSFNWIYPWLIYIISSGILFFLNIITSFFEGCNQISKIQRINLVCVIVNFFIVTISFYLKIYLYALALGALFQCIVRFIFIITYYNKTIIQIFSLSNFDFNWSSQIFKLLSKYSVSFISGYFVFQLFTPVSFRFYGSVFAGKIGMTINLVMAIYSFSSIWIYVVTPKINMLVSAKKWKYLNLLFKKNMYLSILTYVSGALLLILMLFIFPQLSAFQNRLLNKANLILLIIAWLCQLIINGFAIYLRAFKEEPLVKLSLFSGIFILISTIFIGTYLPSNFIFIGFFVTFFWALPFIYNLYVHKRTSQLN